MAYLEEDRELLLLSSDRNDDAGDRLLLIDPMP
jgi:hypothetical protein